jgi:hypothetical protein
MQLHAINLYIVAKLAMYIYIAFVSIYIIFMDSDPHDPRSKEERAGRIVLGF